MATVREVSSFGGGDYSDRALLAVHRDANGAELDPIKFIVDDLEAGADPTAVMGIPQPGDEIITVDGFPIRVDRLTTVRRFPGGQAWVQCLSSSDGRFQFPDRRPVIPIEGQKAISSGYQKEAVIIPTYTTREVIVPIGGAPTSQLEWAREDITITVSFQVLNVIITASEPVSVPDYLALLRLAKAQNGYLHSFDDALWLFEPPYFERTNNGLLRIAYTWISDPGNGPVGINLGLATAPNARMQTIGRDPWTHIQAFGSGAGIPAPPPIMYLTPQFPPGSPRFNPDGWQKLPGNPLE